ncbi:MAG: hypothetical protein JWN14_2291 [Chthonomonadales bacterium]|nr:hypothetical protein [Chthonomonadales bacterium]
MRAEKFASFTDILACNEAYSRRTEIALWVASTVVAVSALTFLMAGRAIGGV